MKTKIILLTVLMTAVSFASQSGFAQKAKAATAKTELVQQLVEIIIQSYPAEEMQNSFRASVEKVSETDIEENEDIIRPVLEKNDRFSTDEKTYLMNNLPHLAALLARQITEAVIKDLKFEEWARKSLAAHYSKKFTVAELNKLIAYFQTDAGNIMLDSINSNLKDIFNPDKTVDDVVSSKETAPFIVSPVGNKFVKIIYENVVKDITDKAIPTEKEQKASIVKVVVIQSDENIGKLLAAFLQENYRQ